MAINNRSTLICDVEGQNFLAIPAELKALSRWVNWRRIFHDGKSTKIPVSPTTGSMASSTDATTWGTYQQALAFLKRGKADGIGFVLGPPFSGIDLDGCRDPKTGVIEPWAHQIIQQLFASAENERGRASSLHSIGMKLLQYKNNFQFLPSYTVKICIYPM